MEPDTPGLVDISYLKINGGGGDDAGMGREEGLGRERREGNTNQINKNK